MKRVLVLAYLSTLLLGTADAVAQSKKLHIAMYAPNAPFASGIDRFSFLTRLAQQLTSMAGVTAEGKAFSTRADFEKAVQLKEVDLAIVDGSYLLAPQQLPPDYEPILAAEPAAKAWLWLLDTGKYDASWDKGTMLFKADVPKPDWAKKTGAERAQLGAAQARMLVSAQFTRSVPGGPNGEYVVLQFETRFANRSAVETVTQTRGTDGRWHVSSYFIK